MNSGRPKSELIEPDGDGMLLAEPSRRLSGARKTARRGRPQRSDPPLEVSSTGIRSETGFIDRTLQLWRPRSSRKLNHEDAHEIAANMTGFFKILAEWLERDKCKSKVSRNESRKPH